MRIFVCLILFASGLQAQPLEYQVAFSKGKIWRASPKLANMFGYPSIAVIGVNYRGFDERDWAVFYPGIRAGAELSYIDFDNSKLGKSLGLSTYIVLRVPYTRNFYSKFSGGANWVSNPYDPQENPDNPALGGPWSLNMSGHLYYEWNMSDEWVLRPGIALHHLSTCSYFQPNTGINVPSLFLEVGNKLPKNLVNRPGKSTFHHPGWDFMLQSGISRKSVEALDRRRFWVASANLGVLRRLTAISLLGLEASFVSSQADNHYSKKRAAEGFLAPGLDYKRLGIAVQHELVFGRVSFYNAIGYYLYDPAGLKKDWYQRYGVRYNLLANLVFSPTMVAHLGTADFFELSLGYRLSTNKIAKE